jgi:ATP-binding cassette subfamily C protein CydC
MLDRTQALAQQYARLQQRLANLNGLQSALTGLLAHLGMFLALIIGIQSVSAGRLPGVYLAVVALAALASFEAVQPLALAAQLSGAHKQAAARLLQIAAEEPVASTGRPVSGGQPPISASPHPRLSVSSVSFTYPGETQPALRDISFNLFPSQRIAIVGPSGAGKTTLLHLLLRFWEYSCGEILVDGVDVRQLDPDDVRRRMAVVPQHTYLFNTSLEENLRLANPQASRQQLELALNQSQLLEFANSLPEGLATQLGEHGLRLSAGQRQRLAIARTLLQPASILILDEPTNSLDTLASRDVMDMLHHLPGERSMLLVTHHLTGLEEFDEILVLKDGSLMERGTHKALRASGGWYGSHCM